MKKPKINIKISPKTFFFIIFVIFGLFFAFFSQYPDQNLHLYFCDVGQGDAIYIKTPQNFDALIDGGPNNKVLGCLSKAMPFWDRTIDLVILTHPQADHLNGLISVIKRYKVQYFVSSPVGNTSTGYQKLKELIEKKKIAVKNLYVGDKITLGGTELVSLWPEKKWLLAQLNSRLGPEAGKIVLGASTSRNLNDFSLVLHLKYGQFDALLTGDGGENIQDNIITVSSIPQVEVLKIPHHGSKTGLLSSFLEKVAPELALISVGKNPWGHPREETLKKLKNLQIKILRTDQEGTIEIVSDGERWTVKYPSRPQR